MAIDIRKRPEGALLRTYLAATGLGPEALTKPLVGVVTAASQVFSERPEARELGGAVTSGIEEAGGIAIRWDSGRPPEHMAWGHAESYNFAWRDQLADLIESWTKQQALDGLVLVGDDQQTLAGMAMAAARLNMPAIIVTTGARRWEYQTPTEGDNAEKKKMADPFELLAMAMFPSKKGSSPTPSPDIFKGCVLTQDDHANNALELALEALGVTLPGMSTVPSQSPKRHDLAYQSGQRVIQLIKTATPFRRALSLNSILNAIQLSAALGGSIDVAIHMMALAQESGLKLSLENFHQVSQSTPQVCRLGGVGEKEPHRIEDLDHAGGVWAIMNTMKNNVHPTTTLSGKGALELAKTHPVKDTKIIHSKRPLRKQSGVGVIRGNLAPQSGVFLQNQVLPELSQFRGPAVIFENEIDAAKMLTAGKIKKGSVIVIRGQGPKGGPGLHMLRILTALMESKGWNKVYPLITDGRLPDTPHGLFISLVSPESALKGPMGVIRNDDIIEIDINTRQLMVRLTDTDLRVRLARWQAPDTKAKRTFLDRYSRSVSDVFEGAVLK